jgi:hypothetical protein
MTSIERPRRPEQFQKVHYPFVAEPNGDCWKVLFVSTDRPFVVAEFDSKLEAIEAADLRNDEAYFAKEAGYAAKALIETVMDRVRAEEEKVRERGLWRLFRLMPWRR